MESNVCIEIMLVGSEAEYTVHLFKRFIRLIKLNSFVLLTYDLRISHRLNPQ